MTQKPNRILVLNSCQKWVGEAAHCFELCRELRRRGRHVLLGVRKGKVLEDAAKREGLPHFALNFSSRFSLSGDLADIRTVRDVVRSEGIELVQCNRGKDHWTAAVALLPKEFHQPLVRARHVVTPAKNHFLNRWIYRKATSALISVSRQSLDEMGELLSVIDQDRCPVIYSAVDAEKFSPQKRDAGKRAEFGAGENGLLIGLIGRFHWVKGQKVFLRAAARLAEEFPTARFLVAGRWDDDWAAQYAALAEEGGFADRYIALGHRDDLPEIVASLDVGVVASLGSEGSSRVSLEYMASGVPVAATSVGGIPELLRGGEFGLLLPPNDVGALVEGLAVLLRDKERRERMAERGRRHVLESHTIERWCDKIEEVYSRVM